MREFDVTRELSTVVYGQLFMSESWWRSAVIYQIYPRSFADSNEDGIGDLAGITSKMDYIAALGVDAIWISPFYPSPWDDGGYDVSDYRDVDTALGTLDDFDAMVDAAHSRELRVLIDIVPNHTSAEHPWFRSALSAEPGSSQRNRYIFREGRGNSGELPPTNWRSRFGGPAWTRLPDGQWYLHLFAPSQPDLNWNNRDIHEEFDDILRFWSRRGVDGFRIDVAAALVKDLTEPLRDVVHADGNTGLDDLAANPDHPFLDRPEVHEIYQQWNRVFHEFDPPPIGVAEAWVPSESRARYTRPDELHQAFNFEFLRIGWDADEYREVLRDSIASASTVGRVATWVLSNHDVVRHPSRFGLPSDTDLPAWLMSGGTQPTAELDLGTRRARAAILFVLGLPGSTYLYQGEELGLPEVPDLPFEAIEDPKWQRSRHREKGRDGCRVPLPWTSDGVSSGFSTVRGWLPQPQGWGEYSVQAQWGDRTSMLELYRSALRVRREFASDETFAWDTAHDAGEVLAYHRAGDILVMVNTGPIEVPLPPGKVLLSSVTLDSASLPGDAAVWLRVS